MFLMIFAGYLILYGLHELSETGAVPFLSYGFHDMTEAWVDENTTGSRLISLAMIAVPLAWLGLAALRDWFIAWSAGYMQKSR